MVKSRIDSFLNKSKGQQQPRVTVDFQVDWVIELLFFLSVFWIVSNAPYSNGQVHKILNSMNRRCFFHSPFSTHKSNSIVVAKFF